MKYYNHFEIVDGVVHVNYFQPEDTNISIPEAPDNTDYARMMEAVEIGEAEIVEVDETFIPTYADHRRAAYASWGDQLDMQYHDLVDDTTVWKDHVAAVKAEHPKP